MSMRHEDQDDQIRQWLSECSSDEEDQNQVEELRRNSPPEGDEPDAVISDFREESDPETDSNISVSSWSSSDEQPLSNFSTTHLVRVLQVPKILRGKNKFLWSGMTPQRRRIPQRNIILHPPGNIGAARHINSPQEAWMLFFNDDVLEQIVIHTNSEIEFQRQFYKNDRLDHDDESSSYRPSYTKPVDLIEMKALIGLYYLCGVLNMNHVTTKELFDKKSGVGYFRATMSLARFEYLTNCLRFDDKLSREERRTSDKLAPIREVFDHIVKVAARYYSPSDCCTLDEQLLPFRGRCPFKMYIPNKPDKYGIKILMLCDSKTGYMIKAEVYLGKGSIPRNIPASEFYCLTMTEQIHNSNRNLTVDNWFTSIPAAQKLLDKGVTMVGTLRKNKKEIPQEFKTKDSRDYNTAMFAFSNNLTLLSYCPQKKKTKKIILLLSTMHDMPDKDKTIPLPEIIQLYNKTKVGVDLHDQLSHKYSVIRRTKRWPLTIFYGLLDTVGINANILYHVATNNKEPRRKFLKSLALTLIKPHMERRFDQPTLNVSLKKLIGDILEKHPVYEVATPGPSVKKRCFKCTSNKDRKTRFFCALCKKYLCLEHSEKVCADCINSINN